MLVGSSSSSAAAAAAPAEAAEAAEAFYGNSFFLFPMLGDLYLIDLSSLCRCASPASSFPPLPHSAGNRVFILDSMEAVFALLCLVFFYFLLFLLSFFGML